MDPQPHTRSSMQNNVHECLSSTLQKCENRMGRDLGCREDVDDVKYRLAVTHVPRGISCAISVLAKVTSCVRRKQQTCDMDIPSSYSFSSQKSYLTSMFFFTCLHY